MNLNELLNKAKKNHFFRYGLPFIIFITGGSFVLKQFATVRYEISRHNKQLGVTPELLKEVGFKVKPTKSLEEEYESLTVNTEWKNIRGPRPWEQPSQEYLQMVEKRAAEMKKNKMR